MSLILPSYQSGFAPRDYEPAYPSLWQGCVAAYAPLLGPTGLVLRDVTAAENHGVLQNFGLTGSTSNFVVDEGRYCLDFDGANDRVLTTAQGPATSRRAVSCWFKTSTVLSSGQFVGLVAWNDTVFNSAFVVIQGNGGNLSNNGIGVSQWGDATGATGFNDGRWHSITIVNVGTNWRVYIDAILRSQRTMTTTPASNVITIGGYLNAGTPGTNANFTGRLDDILVYNRDLTDNEIKLLASRRGIAYDYKTHRSYSKTQSSGLLKRLLLTGQT